MIKGRVRTMNDTKDTKPKRPQPTSRTAEEILSWLVGRSNYTEHPGVRVNLMGVEIAGGGSGTVLTVPLEGTKFYVELREPIADVVAAFNEAIDDVEAEDGRRHNEKIHG